MYQIVPLAEQTLSAIYQVHMVRDFPSSELKPLSAILDWMRKGRYVAVGCYQGEELLAYACLCRSLSGETLLLDYFAVVGDRRSQGVGSAFLRQLHQNFQEKEEYQGIVLEIESVESAGTGKNKRLGREGNSFISAAGWNRPIFSAGSMGWIIKSSSIPSARGKVAISSAWSWIAFTAFSSHPNGTASMSPILNLISGFRNFLFPLTNKTPISFVFQGDRE